MIFGDGVDVGGKGTEKQRDNNQVSSRYTLIKREALCSREIYVLHYFFLPTRSTHASPGAHGVDNNDGTLTPELQEEYIDLMCQVSPSQVYAYLKGAEGYRLEQTLEVS